MCSTSSACSAAFAQLPATRTSTNFLSVNDCEIELSKSFDKQGDHKTAQPGDSRGQRNDIEFVSDENDRRDHEITENVLRELELWLGSVRQHTESCRGGTAQPMMIEQRKQAAQQQSRGDAPLARKANWQAPQPPRQAPWCGKSAARSARASFAACLRLLSGVSFICKACFQDFVHCEVGL